MVPVHCPAGVPAAQMRTDVGSSVAPDRVESLASGLMTWFTSHVPVLVSATAFGGGMTSGVYVDDIVLPSASVTW